MIRAWGAHTPHGAAAAVASYYARVEPGRVFDLTADAWLVLVAARAGRCAYCDRVPAATRDDHLVIDHCVPMYRGGDHTATNVVPACNRCNGQKGDLTPLEWFAVRAGLMRRAAPKDRAAGVRFVQLD